MHSVYFIFGILSVVLLYCGTAYVTLQSLRHTQDWLKLHEICQNWPETNPHYIPTNMMSRRIPCELPALERSRSQGPEDPHLAKSILLNAVAACEEENKCND